MHIVKAGDNKDSEGAGGQLFGEVSGAGADASHRDKSVFNLENNFIYTNHKEILIEISLILFLFITYIIRVNVFLLNMRKYCELVHKQI